MKKNKKTKLGVTQDQVLGLQRAQAYYHPPARGALVPLCEDRQRGSALWSLSAAAPPQSIWEGRPLRRCCKEVQALLPLNYSWGGWLAPSRHRGPVWMEREKLRCANRPIQGPRCWKFPGFLPATHRTRPLSSQPHPRQVLAAVERGGTRDRGPDRAQSPSAGRGSRMGFYLGQREGTLGAESVCGFGSAKTKE